MANPTGMVRPDNCQLLHLSESTILHNVRRRFEGEGESEGEGASPQLRAVYTYTGSILLALNPFEKLPLYGTEQMRSYVGRPLGAVAPHTYAMAEEAYRCLLQTKSSQSLVVSGESGAGKTEANKQLMRYLAFRSKKGEQLTDLASTILQSNPVLEAFGNAKTARNDNSSRFGKFVKIAMSDTGEVPCWCHHQAVPATLLVSYLTLSYLNSPYLRCWVPPPSSTYSKRVACPSRVRASVTTTSSTKYAPASRTTRTWPSAKGLAPSGTSRR